LNKKYQYFDHTADLGIEIYGDDIQDLFINTGLAIFETQIIGDVRSIDEREIELKAVSLEDLLIDWCRELLYLFSVKHFIPCDYAVNIKDLQLSARIKGETFDRTRHRIHSEIKNVTYHNFKIDMNKSRYKATIIFDV